MLNTQDATILSVIKDRLTIKNTNDNLHTRGVLITGNLEIDGIAILSYAQHGNGNLREVNYLKHGEERCKAFLQNINFNDAMRNDGWLEVEETAPLSYQISTAFECLYDHTHP